MVTPAHSTDERSTRSCLSALALVFRLRRLLMAGLLAGIIVRGRRGRTRLMLRRRRGTRCGLLHIRSRLILRRTRVGRPRRGRGRRRCRPWDFVGGTRRGGFRSGIRLCWMRIRRHVGPSGFTVRSMRIRCLRLRRTGRGGFRSGIRLCWMRVRRHVGPSSFTVRSMRIRGLRLRRTRHGTAHRRRRCGIC